MISALLAAMVAVLVVVAGLLAVVLALLCRILVQWGTVADSKARCRATRTPIAERHFSGGRGAVDASIHSTTKVVRR